MTGFTNVEIVTACPVCGDRDIRPAFPPDVAQCAECGTFFRTPRPTRDEIEASYNRGVMYAEWQEQRAVRELLWATRVRLVRTHCAGGSLLDIGTGDGAFLGFATAAGFNPVGTELSATGAAMAAARGHDVRVGTLEEIDFGDTRFDLVTMWHVLEHVPNPGECLARVRRLLAPGGTLVVAVPNEDRILFLHRLGWSPSDRPLGGLVPGEEIHLTHFQPQTLKRALTRLGFEVVAFGVDDVDLRRTPRNWLKRAASRGLSALTGWHFSTAMYAVGRRSESEAQP